jgi:U3 small nucleolar RNA-associated protein 10
MFRIDTLIACIRTSKNPQVHNRTLLLLSSLSHIIPEVILSHLMPIFTFMGASVLRQDDEYSAHVIEQTIKSIIPILANVAVRGTEFDSAPIISAFVINFDFIPKHRRLSLFKSLLEALGLGRSIAISLFLLAEKSAQSNERTRTIIREFISDLANSFAVSDRFSVRSILGILTLDNLRLPRTCGEDARGSGGKCRRCSD